MTSRREDVIVVVGSLLVFHIAKDAVHERMGLPDYFLSLALLFFIGKSKRLLDDRLPEGVLVVSQSRREHTIRLGR